MVNRNRAKYPPKHKSDNKFNYHQWRAQIQTICRRRQIRRTALKVDSFKYNYVVEKLKLFWSPEQIAMRMRLDFPNQIIGVATIYRYIKRGDLPEITKCFHTMSRNAHSISCLPQMTLFGHFRYLTFMQLRTVFFKNLSLIYLYLYVTIR